MIDTFPIMFPIYCYNILYENILCLESCLFVALNNGLSYIFIYLYTEGKKVLLFSKVEVNADKRNVSQKVRKKIL